MPIPKSRHVFLEVELTSVAGLICSTIYTVSMLSARNSARHYKTAVATAKIVINTKSCQSGLQAPVGRRHIWSIASTVSDKLSCAMEI